MESDNFLSKGGRVADFDFHDHLVESLEIQEAKKTRGNAAASEETIGAIKQNYFEAHSDSPYLLRK